MERDVGIVLYHHISSDLNPLTNKLNVSTAPELFEQHVRYFSKNFELVGPDDLLSGILPRKALLITFDDAYRSVLDVAAPILRSVNAPSLFFLNPATITMAKLPIDNVLSFAEEELGLKRVLTLMEIEGSAIRSTSELISNIIAEMKQVDVKAVKQRLLSTLSITDKELYDESKLFLMPQDIAEFSRYRMEVGNHSMEHTFFRTLSEFELEAQITESRAALQRVSAQPVPCLSVPYGDERDATEPALRVARASGHEAIFLVHARSNRFRIDKDVYYRVSLQNTPVHDLALKIRVMPILRSLRNWIRRPCARSV